MRRMLVVALLATVVVAEPPDLPTSHLELRAKFTLREGTRGLRDAFPYLRGLTPETVGDCVTIDSAQRALEAVRLFVAGPLVRDANKAALMFSTGEALRGELKHLTVKLHKHRPASYEPTASPTPNGWKVSLVALEMDRMLQLVHVEATVSKTGELKITRHLMVEGPMTSWQSGYVAGDSKARAKAESADTAMFAEALEARRRYAAALRPAKDLDTAWILARLRLTPTQIRDLWGPHDHVCGSGRRIVAYDIEPRGAVVFDATAKDRAPQVFTHFSRAPEPMGKRGRPAILHRLSTGAR